MAKFVFIFVLLALFAFCLAEDANSQFDAQFNTLKTEAEKIVGQGSDFLKNLHASNVTDFYNQFMTNFKSFADKAQAEVAKLKNNS